jgi:hypothetical protein
MKVHSFLGGRKSGIANRDSYEVADGNRVVLMLLCASIDRCELVSLLRYVCRHNNYNIRILSFGILNPESIWLGMFSSVY